MKEAGCVSGEADGALGEIRTPDLLVRSQTLYPTELRARGVRDSHANFGVFECQTLPSLRISPLGSWLRPRRDMSRPYMTKR